MDLKSAVDHIKRSTVPTDKWKADDFIADNCPPEAGEMEAAFAAIMNAVADGALAQNHEGIISRLSEKVNTLITEKHADAEAIGALEDKLAEVTAERDRLQAAGTFAQGIEAAVELHEQLWRETDAYKRDRIRALSPTTPVDANETPVHEHQAGLTLANDPQAPQADPVREASQRLMPGAIEALSAYQQADMDGTMVLVSRQAIEECLPVLRALTQKGE